MEKKRHLRKGIQYTLAGINTVILIALVSLHDFELAMIPWIFGAMAVFVINTWVLYRWGNIADLLIDEEEDEAL